MKATIDWWVRTALVLLSSSVGLSAFELRAAPPPPELDRSVDRKPTADPQQRGEVLTLEDVLSSLVEHDPRLESADQAILGAEGRVLTARGDFDTRARVRGLVQPLGHYRNGVLDVRIEQPTPVYGLTAWAGWRIGVGSFPIQDSKLLTASGGEVSIGVNLPLWRDGAIDRRRASISQAKLERERLDRVREARELQLEADAAAAYWTWVARGLRLEIERTLLDLALERDEGLRRKIELGATRPIVGMDNQQVILAREARMVAAEREFQSAALALSLFSRDESGEPQVHGVERLPEELPALPAPTSIATEAEIDAARERRPDRQARLSTREQGRIELRLARNQRAPKVDVSTWIAQDFGVGPESLQPFEWVAAVELEIPIPLRQARGRVRTATAELARIDADLRFLDDQIAVEILDAHFAVVAAYRRAGITSEQVALAESLAEAEYRSFTLGAGDLLLVNLRELASADASAEHVQAVADFFIAKAELEVARGEGVRSTSF